MLGLILPNGIMRPAVHFLTANVFGVCCQIPVVAIRIRHIAGPVAAELGHRLVALRHRRRVAQRRRAAAPRARHRPTFRRRRRGGMSRGDKRLTRATGNTLLPVGPLSTNGSKSKYHRIFNHNTMYSDLYVPLARSDHQRTPFALSRPGTHLFRSHLDRQSSIRIGE